jgi:tetratricopeptide (TPR) repeat protein
VLNGQIDISWSRRRDMAVESLDKALELNADDANALLLLARLHLVLPGGDMDRGRDSAERAVKLFAENPARRAEALVVRARYTTDAAQQLDLLEQALAADPQNLDARRLRAQVRLLREDASGAVADLEVLLAQNPDDPETVEQLAQALAAQEKYDEAIQYVDKLIKLAPDALMGYRLRSAIHMMQGKPDLALRDLDEALQRDSDDLDILMARARLHEHEKHYEQSLADVNRILELRPGWPAALLLRANIATLQDRLSDAIVDLKRLQAVEPDNPTVLLQLATLLQADKRPRRAIELFNQLTDHEDTALRTYALRSRGDAHLSIGKHAEAVKDFEQALTLNADDDGLLNNLAWVLCTSPQDQIRNGQKALEYARHACELTDYKEAHILSTLAAAYAELGQWDEAMKWSKKSLEAGSGEVLEQLQQELASYQKKNPWRESQEEVENPNPEPEPPVDDDLIIDSEKIRPGDGL